MGIPEPRMAFIALRDIDQFEKNLLRRSGCAVFTMHEVDKWGIGPVMDMVMHRINPHNDRPIHLTFDIDGCDPSISPGTGTCSRGGVNFRESHYICESLAMTSNLTSMDVVEINPDLDVPVQGRMHGDNELIKSDLTTVRLGLELASSALGRASLLQTFLISCQFWSVAENPVPAYLLIVGSNRNLILAFLHHDGLFN